MPNIVTVKPKQHVSFLVQVIAVIACSWLVASIMVYYVVAKDAFEIASLTEETETSPLLGSININEALDDDSVDLDIEPAVPDLEKNLDAPISREPSGAQTGSSLPKSEDLAITPDEDLASDDSPISQRNTVYSPSSNSNYNPGLNAPPLSDSPEGGFGDELIEPELFEPEPVERGVPGPEDFEHENFCLAGETRTSEDDFDELCFDGLWIDPLDLDDLIAEAVAFAEANPDIASDVDIPVDPESEPAPPPPPQPVCYDGETGQDSYGEDALCFGGQWVANLEIEISSNTSSFTPSSGDLIVIETTANTSAFTSVAIFPILSDSTNPADIALINYLAKSNPSDEEALSVALALLNSSGPIPAFKHMHTYELARGYVKTYVWNGELPYGGGVVPGDYVLIFYAQNYNMRDQALAIIDKITVN